MKKWRICLRRNPAYPSFLFKCSFVKFFGGDCLPPRGVESPKRKRQYEHIKESELKSGESEETAERIAAATVNKTRREKGETKT
jgi:hypothetical protein